MSKKRPHQQRSLTYIHINRVCVCEMRICSIIQCAYVIERGGRGGRTKKTNLSMCTLYVLDSVAVAIAIAAPAACASTSMLLLFFYMSHRYVPMHKC